jgi:phage major head subunit gpT-like protein
MELNSETLNAANKAYQLLYDNAFAAVTPQSASFMMDIPISGSGATLIIPEGMGKLWEHTGKNEKRVPISWDVELKNRDFVLDIAVPRNAFLDDQLGLYNLQFMDAGAAAASQPDDLFVALLTAAFTTNGPDGRPFIGSTHKRARGQGNQSNVVTGALNETTFNTAVASLMGQTDYHGRPLKLWRRGAKLKLVVGPSLRATALDIVQSELGTGGKSNPNAGMAEVEILPDLTGDYADYWFLVYTDGPLRPFVHGVRQAPRFYSYTDPNSESVHRLREVLYGVERRGDAAYGVYQTIVGSLGESE